MQYDVQFQPSTLGHFFQNFYFLPVWLLFNFLRVHFSRDMHLLILSRYKNINGFMEEIAKKYSIILFWDLGIFLTGTNLLFWLLGGNFEWNYYLLYFVAFYLITFIYWMMLTWSKVFLKSYSPILLLTFTFFLYTWFYPSVNPYFNPFLAISTVFTKNSVGYQPSGPPPAYNLEMIFAFFISVMILAILCILIIHLKKRRINI